VYVLGIDLGTTFTAAAVWREGRAEICSLGTHAAAVPSVVLLRPDDSMLTGEAANRRALIEPDRVAREFKRRFGDSTPVLLGGSPYSADALTARLLAAVVADVSAREGGEPTALAISHPANWGPFKTDLLRQAVRMASLDLPVQYTTEPEAAAISYSQEQRLAVGETIAVYDLGGGTFDAAVLRRTPQGFTILGQPEGIERLGGIDIDAAVFNHVVQSLGDKFTALDEDDPSAVTAVARLRQECTEAKEALSSDTDVSIPVILPGVSTEVRLTRAELESMVRPALYDSIEALKRALRSAGVTSDELSAVLLVGGSSRMPLVAQLVGAELGRPVAVDVHPKHAVALGAAWLASGQALPADAVTPSSAPSNAPSRPAPSTSAPSKAPSLPAAPATRVTPVAASRPTVPAAASVLASVVPPASVAPPASAASVAPTSSPGSVTSPRSATPQAFAGSYQATPFQAPARQPSSAGLPYPPDPSGPISAYPPASPAVGLPYAPQPRPSSGSGRNRAVLAGVGALLLVSLAVVGGWTYLHGNAKTPVALTTPAASSPADSAASPTGATATATTAAAAAAPPVVPVGVAPAATGLITVSFQGSGTVSGALNCHGTCRLRLTTGQTLHLHAEPATGFAFGRWTGCSGSSNQDCTVVVAPQNDVGVVFTKTAASTTASSSTATPTTSTSTGVTTASTTSSAAAQVPGAVTSMSLSGATATTVNVDWGSAPRATRYRLGWTESPSGRTWDSSGQNYGGGPVTLTNLTSGSSYTVRVTPYNDAGDGPTTTRTATLP
jgi:molecular chaperone DnaK